MLTGWRPATQRWIPVCTAVACLTVTVLSSLAVLAKDRRNTQTSAAALAGSVAGQIQGNMKSFVLAVTRMAHRLEIAHESRQGEWEADAENHLRDIPGLAALVRLDSASVIRWVMPHQGSEKFIDKVLNQDPARHRILQETRDANATRVSPVLELFGGGYGILMFSPIHRDDESAGFLVAVFRMAGLWNSLPVDGSAKGYRIEVLEGQRRLYESMPARSVNEQLGAQSSVSLPGIVWTVRAQPPSESFFLGGSPSTLAIALAGVIVSLLLPLSIAFAQAAGLRAKESDLVKGQRIEMDRVKNEFISTVSHELRTPLTSIAGSLGLVAGGVGGELPAKAAQLVQIAERNSHRLVRLIDDILYIEKAAAGRLEFDLESQALTPIVRQAIEANQEYARGFGVEIELTGPVPDVIVRVDRDRLIQVLTNLISNAAKFSPQGSKVTLDIHEGGGRVQVSVRDCGPGIAEAFRSRIFQQFAQADDADVRNKGGTGLGLSIAKMFMERLGGGIGYETVEGEGSMFFISLPAWTVTSS